MKPITSLASLALFILAAPATAQMDRQPACPAEAEPIPAALAAWKSQAKATAAADARGLAAAALAPGTAVDAALSRTGSVQYVVRPEKPGGSVSYGGMFAVKVVEAGTYRVALGSAAWIDVLHGKSAVESTAHGRGPACSGIRKMVDFPLQKGDYVLQIAANGTPSVPVLFTKLP